MRFHCYFFGWLLLAPWPLPAQEPRLGEIIPLTTDGQSIAPRFSPQDANLLGFSRPGYQGIWLLRSRSASNRRSAEPSIISLSDQPKAGFGWTWSATGDAARTRKLDTLPLPTEWRPPISSRRAESTAPPPITIHQHRVIWHGAAVTPENTRCFLPQIAGQRLVAECWQGLYGYDHATGEGWWLGKGHRPLWLADGESLVFERTWDDGQKLLGADIYWYDWTRKREVNLTAKREEILRRPSVSADGQWLAMDLDQNLLLAPLHWEDQP